MRWASADLSLVAVGKLKSPPWTALQADYTERIKRYAPFRVIEVKDATIEREGQALLKETKAARFRVALTPGGQTLDSRAWAEMLRKQIDTYQQISFMIGGPEGLASEVLQASPLRLSLSPMTFPHELARIAFLEQLYRAFTLLNGEKYHK